MDRILRNLLAAAPLMLSTAACAQNSVAPVDQPPTTAPAQYKWVSLFDPAKHMRVDEVREGMKGFGLSVFHGTKIERFDVEVISVLRNFNPKGDVIFIRCAGQNLEHTGSIQGMSGSPIYLIDETGKPRMIGAFAYGYSLAKDPIAGVQPIEYMLAYPESLGNQVNENQPKTSQIAPSGREWSLATAGYVRGIGKAIKTPDSAGMDRSSVSSPAMSPSQLRPLLTPLAVGGVPASVLREMKSEFDALSLVPLQAGSSSAPSTTNEAPPALEPGASLVSTLMSGDIDASVVGTVTEAIGDKVFGFGHPFNNEGSIDMPMGTGRVNAIVASLSNSFKLGSLVELQGALVQDRQVGVMGTRGLKSRFIPVSIRVVYDDGTSDQTFNVQMVRHPRFTPMLAAMAISSAISGRHELPADHQLSYDIKIDFENGKSVNVSNRESSVVGDGMMKMPVDLRGVIGSPIAAAAENPFQRVMPSKIDGVVRVSRRTQSAAILSANLPRTRYRPGETLRAFLAYRPYQGNESVLPIEFVLPKDLADGTYQFVISDVNRYISDEAATRAFRFRAESIDDVFDVLQDAGSIRADAIYARLTRAADGIAMGRVAMPHLPVSKRNIFTNAGRSNTAPFASSEVKIIPTDIIYSGAAEFQITIDSQHHVEIGAQKPGKPDGQAAPVAPAAAPVKSDPKSDKPAKPKDTQP